MIAGYAASCTEAGLLEHYECMECYAWFWDAAASKPITEPRETYLEALGHSFGGWLTVKEPSDSETGLAERVCQHDPSHKETRELPMLGEGSTTTSGENEESSSEGEGISAPVDESNTSSAASTIPANQGTEPLAETSSETHGSGNSGGGLASVLPWLLMLPLMLIIGILSGMLIAGKKKNKEE